MADWSLPFEESMLDQDPCRVIIWCPERDLATELFAILEAHGVRWIDDGPMSNTGWNSCEEETCYRVTESRRLKRGDTECYSRYDYDDNIRCQFYGVGPDIEISDADFETVISAGGGS